MPPSTAKWCVVALLAILTACGNNQTKPTDPYANGLRPWGEQSAQINAIESGGYLSDLPWNAASNGWGPVERDKTNGDWSRDDGSPLLLNGQTYLKGIGVHAPSTVEYALDPSCRRLQAIVGVDGSSGPTGPLVFTVNADEETVFTSDPMNESSPPVTLDVNIAKRAKISLTVTNTSGKARNGRAVWADAKLICGKVTEVRFDQTELVVGVGDTIDLQPEVLGKYSFSKETTWSVDPGFAELKQSSSSTTFVAQVKGQFTVKAASAEDETQSASVKINVVDPNSRSLTGEWSSAIPWPTTAIHASLLPSGNVMTFGWYVNYPYSGPETTKIDVWNPKNNTHSTTLNTTTDMFGAGHDVLPNGKLFVSSGTVIKTHFAGSKKQNLYDEISGRWTQVASTNVGHWYPTVKTLPNEEVLVAAGYDAENIDTKTHEVYNPQTDTVRVLSNVNVPMPTYPFIHVAPSGRTIVTGPDQNMAFLETSGQGKWTPIPKKRDAVYRSYGTSVSFVEGKALVLGGGNPASATATLVDMNTGVSTPTNPMQYARRNLNAVLLADGTVLAVGGNTLDTIYGEMILPAELWNPKTEKWSTMTAMSIARPYHSTALLLPDARVLVAGGKEEIPGYNTAQIFTPPYLFQRNNSNLLAVRPRIFDVTNRVAYRQNVTAVTSAPEKIQKVSFVRLGSTTHALDFGQHFVNLKFQSVSGGLEIQMPDNPNLAPPGYYMLFIVDGAGVPSESRILQLREQ